MTIQLGRTRPIEQIQYPGRKDGGGVAGHIHKFWAPKHQQQQQPQSFVKSKTPQPTATKSTIITSTKNQQQQSEPQSNSKPQQQSVWIIQQAPVNSGRNFYTENISQNLWT